MFEKDTKNYKKSLDPTAGICNNRMYNMYYDIIHAIDGRKHMTEPG